MNQGQKLGQEVASRAQPCSYHVGKASRPCGATSGADVPQDQVIAEARGGSSHNSSAGLWLRTAIQGGEQLESMAADIVSKFCYWKKAEGQINESDMTIIHALTAEDEVHQQRRLANEIIEDEEKGLKNSITEVRREC